MGGPFTALEMRLHRAASGLARSAVLVAIIAVAGVTAAVFATVAGFIAMTEALGAAWAALIVAGVYALIALIAALLLRRPAPPPPPVALTAPPPPPLAEAFLTGLQTGRSFGEGFRSGRSAK